MLLDRMVLCKVCGVIFRVNCDKEFPDGHDCPVCNTNHDFEDEFKLIVERGI